MPSFLRRGVAAVSVLALFAGAAVALSLLPAGPSARATNGFAISGIDIASWQHPGGAPIDWRQVRAAGQSFALVKATESTTYVNPFYSSDRADASAAGLVIGAYHYARPQLPLSTAEAQARFFVDAVGTQQLARTLPPVLDLEETGGLSKQQLEAWAKRFLSTTASLTGRTPMLYSYDAFLRASVDNVEGFRGYPLWYANYRSAPPGPLPGAWSSWHIWQYTSSGRVPGIAGRVDVNWFHGSMSQLLSFASGRVPARSGQSNVQKYERTKVTGRVDPVYAGETIVRRERKKSGAWVDRKKKRLAADGTYSFTVRPTTKRTRSYRVHLNATSPYARVRSTTVTVSVVDPWAKASISRASMKKGKRAKITGRVDKFYTGQRIVRQKRTASGAWKTQATKRVKARGHYAFWVKPSARSTHRYRALLRAKKPTVVQSSRTVSVRVR